MLAGAAKKIPPLGGFTGAAGCAAVALPKRLVLFYPKVTFEASTLNMGIAGLSFLASTEGLSSFFYS